MEHGMNIMERIADQRLRDIVVIDEKFMKGKGSMDTMFATRQIQEKKIRGNQALYCTFVDLGEGL